MTTEISTLRPGLLVSLKTSIRGNVKYRIEEIEADHLTVDGERKARWETERTIVDPAEHERAIKARGKARTAVLSVCAQSAFGLLCPEAKADQLRLALVESRRIAEAFNGTASVTRIDVNIICGRVASDDVEALRAIHSELRELLESMAEGVKRLDAATIREAANKARSVSQMLTPAAAERVAEAIEVARKAARAIVKAGDTAAVEIDKETLNTLASARTAFLDLDVPEAAAAAIEPTGASSDRTVDFDSAGFDAPLPSGPALPALEME